MPGGTGRGLALIGSAAVPTAASAMAPERPYELVVFGASGFTGQFVVEEVARVAASGELRGGLRWAVAGRSREKLQAVLERAAERLGTGRGRGSCGAAELPGGGGAGATPTPRPRPRPLGAAAGGRERQG